MPPPYPPGSFTKNFGWNRSPPGLRRLRDTINAGFRNDPRPTRRHDFRRHCGVSDADRQLIPVNFFLHNSVLDGVNFVTVDELVLHAINSPYSSRFDWLALFALHLSRAGRRVGVAGDPRGAAFTNDFVRTHLWNNGGWQTTHLTESVVEDSFATTITAQGADTIHKCVTNYLFILELVGLRQQTTPYINTHFDEWVGPGLFLAFDRYSVDRVGSGTPDRAELLSMVGEDELHKLAGTTQASLNTVAQYVVDEYLALGGLGRVGQFVAATPTAPVGAPSGSPPRSAPARTGGSRPVRPSTWSDEAAEDAALILRRQQEIQAQIRNSQHVRELKMLYQNACAFCGKRTIVGVDPSKHYSEAAHIKPVGQPHNGPDRKDNMIILCPEHHLQFDRGVLRIQNTLDGLTLVSKIQGDPLNDSRVRVQSPHQLNDDYISWHYEFWKR